MSNLPLISIIIPAYNAGRWIAQACNSVLMQTYKNWELIVVDDGSVDETYKIVKEISTIHSLVNIIHIENGGVCKARNVGIEASRGEYITFLDADDLFVVNSLEKLYRAMEAYEADIIVGGRCNIDENGGFLESPYPKECKVLNGMQALESSLLDHPSSYTVWGKLYKKGIIGDIRFIEGKHVHEDSFFVFQCYLKKPKVVLIDDIVVQYRITENSASRAPFSEKFFDILYFAEQKKLCIEKQYPEYDHLAENVIIKAKLSLLKNLCKTKEKRYRSCEKTYIQEIVKKRKCFIPAISSDRRIFWIVTHHMYKLYKFIYFPIRQKINGRF
ncbi:MAG: glycosyltransferase [Lachnospiraceae bacterium]|nr:glycosyltransferase [Lachnospiraceae bacterium]